MWHNGTEYDSKAILGVAYLHATGQPASSEEFSGGEAGAAKVLAELGFDVVVDEHVAAQKPTQKRAASKPKKRTAYKPLNLCPTCHMALPATGICDNCG